MAVPDIDATAGGASANSYGTVAEANAYFEIRPGSHEWINADADGQKACLQFAVVLIDRETYFGSKRSASQALEFPRHGDDDENGDPFIYTDVKHAQFEQALDLLKGDYMRRLRQDEIQEGGIRQVTTGQSQIRSTVSRPSLAVYKLCTAARGLLLQFVEMSVKLGRA